MDDFGLGMKLPYCFTDRPVRCGAIGGEMGSDRIILQPSTDALNALPMFVDVSEGIGEHRSVLGGGFDQLGTGFGHGRAAPSHDVTAGFAVFEFGDEFGSKHIAAGFESGKQKRQVIVVCGHAICGHAE